MADADPGALREVLMGLAGPVVDDHAAELVDIEVAGSGTYNVRLLVHHTDGVNVLLCERIAREVSDLFDVEDPIPGRYRLEVTSPGLDRPLRSDADFRRAAERLLKIVTREGRTERGRLAGFTQDSIELSDGKQQRHVARADIAKATIEVEF